MEKDYLVDTNILIYYFADAIPKKELDLIEKISKTSFNISVITKIEFLGWEKHTEVGFEKARKFVDFADVIPLTNEIANLTIDIRRICKIKLPDAVIAATALHTNLIIVTRDEDDFKDVEGLRIYNPFT
jgi:hypothetical protein